MSTPEDWQAISHELYQYLPATAAWDYMAPINRTGAIGIPTIWRYPSQIVFDVRLVLDELEADLPAFLQRIRVDANCAAGSHIPARRDPGGTSGTSAYLEIVLAGAQMHSRDLFITLTQDMKTLATVVVPEKVIPRTDWRPLEGTATY